MTTSTWLDLHRRQVYGRWPAETVVAWFCRNWPMAGERRFIKVLDLGCGGGANTRMLADEGFTITAMDISPDAITNARYLLQRWHQDHATFVVGDVTKPLPFGDGEFHAVLDGLCTTHLDSPSPVEAEIFRVLKPSGRYFTRSFHVDSERIYGRGMVKYYETDERLNALFSCGFSDVEWILEATGGVKIITAWGKKNA